MSQPPASQVPLHATGEDNAAAAALESSARERELLHGMESLVMATVRDDDDDNDDDVQARDRHDVFQEWGVMDGLSGGSRRRGLYFEDDEDGVEESHDSHARDATGGSPAPVRGAAGFVFGAISPNTNVAAALSAALSSAQQRPAGAGNPTAFLAAASGAASNDAAPGAPPPMYVPSVGFAPSSTPPVAAPASLPSSPASVNAGAGLPAAAGGSPSSHHSNSSSSHHHSSHTSATAAAPGAAPSTRPAPRSVDGLFSDPNDTVAPMIDAEHIRSNLFICSLPHHITDDDLRKKFSEFGMIESAKVMLNIHTGESRGIAFVKFAYSDDAERALAAMNNSYYFSERQPLIVRVANSKAAYLPGAPTNKTFVRNVPVELTRADLVAFFEKFGEVVDVSIHADSANDKTPYGSSSAAFTEAGGGSSRDRATPEAMTSDGRRTGSLRGSSPSSDNESGAVGDAAKTGGDRSDGSSGTPPAEGRALNILFVTFATKESARLAAEAIHTRVPFKECRGVPLLAKVAEDNARRIERLHRKTRHTPGADGVPALTVGQPHPATLAASGVVCARGLPGNVAMAMRAPPLAPSVQSPASMTELYSAMAMAFAAAAANPAAAARGAAGGDSSSNMAAAAAAAAAAMFNTNPTATAGGHGGAASAATPMYSPAFASGAAPLFPFAVMGGAVPQPHYAPPAGAAPPRAPSLPSAPLTPPIGALPADAAAQQQLAYLLQRQQAVVNGHGAAPAPPPPPPPPSAADATAYAQAAVQQNYAPMFFYPQFALAGAPAGGGGAAAPMPSAPAAAGVYGGGYYANGGGGYAHSYASTAPPVFYVMGPNGELTEANATPGAPS